MVSHQTMQWLLNLPDFNPVLADLYFFNFCYSQVCFSTPVKMPVLFSASMPTLRRQQTAPEDGHWARWQDTQGVHSCGSTSSPQTSRPWGPSRDPAAHSEPCPCSRGPHPAPCRDDASHTVEDWTRASLEHEPKPDVPPAGLGEGRQPCPVGSSVQDVCYKGQACRLNRV